jgi:transcriptional antiterminator Rof (Rho-off)
MWYSDIDCQWHYTLLAYEDGSTLHSNKADTVKQALAKIEHRIAKLMEEEAHEVQSN